MNRVTLELYRQAVREIAPTYVDQHMLAYKIGIGFAILEAFMRGTWAARTTVINGDVLNRLVVRKLETFLASLEN